MDVEQNARRTLEFCNLKCEPVCLEFYKLNRSVDTASSEQVQQPFFRVSLLHRQN